MASIAAIGTLAALFGIGGGAIGVLVIGALLYAAAQLQQRITGAAQRETNRLDAFRWSGLVVDARPDHFDIRQSHERLRKSDQHPSNNVVLAPYVERTVAPEFRERLTEGSVIILQGPRPSGKSRLVYEVLSDNDDGAKIWISRNVPADPEAADPLSELMADRGALEGDRIPTVLVIRDFVTRLLRRTISADLVRDWIENEDRGKIVITFSLADIAEIERSPWALQELQTLERAERSRVIPLSDEFDSEEMALAREIYPSLGETELKWLPEYLCSATRLRSKFTANASDGNVLGRSIVHAVADWRRAGMTRPANKTYIRSRIDQYAPAHTDEDFEAQLQWALEPVETVMSLIRADGDGYVPDPIIVDHIDGEDGQNRQLDEHVWEGILWYLRAEAETGRENSATISDLIELSRAARRRGSPVIGEQALDLAKELGGSSDQKRIERERGSTLNPGSAEAVVSAQSDDSVRARLAERQGVVRTGKDELPRRLVAWIYSRVLARTVVRTVVLVIADGFSVMLGFGVGLILRAAVEKTSVTDALSDSLRWLPLWIAGSIFVLARLHLYKRDAPRGRLSPILLAGLILGCIGLLTTSLGDAGVGLIPQVAIGTGLAVTTCYLLRALYDMVSRAWVEKNGLRARTLLIGSERQYDEFAKPLSKSTRPTKIVGFVTLNEHDIHCPECLGSVEKLPAIARDNEVGRVVILDTTLPPERRQEIANLCHRREVDGYPLDLKVEAVPSLADIRANGIDFVVGQAVPLIRLEPLWQADLAFFLKRVFDVLFASLGVVLLAPVWLWIAGLVRREGRPVLVREDRRGRGNTLFSMYRFRTTPVGTPSDSNDGDRSRDPHTSYGESLKERGLDELPQLLNVLLGDMSLVGPRPLHVKNHSQLSPAGVLRYVVKPGMTGPWLVSGHTHLTYSQLATLDVAYLQRWTFIADLDILAKTLPLVWLGRRKYPSLFAPEPEED